MWWNVSSKQSKLARALKDLESNQEQFSAVHEKGNCVVLAGPGSGKTKTLATAIIRTLVEDVIDPRGVACITYNNECAIELETRIAKLGVKAGDRCFIGTVHSFALSQIIAPYARCIEGLLPVNFRVATNQEKRAAIEKAYAKVFMDGRNPHDHWRYYAEPKRLKSIDRNEPSWLEQKPKLADFIEAYESELRLKELIDFDDMPLVAFRMVKEHLWIRDAVRAKFPVLFVDEYQDLGYALHGLVQVLCFDGGIRLFAVGDVDQSIYGFNNANPKLLEQLSQRHDVRCIKLKFNYRSGHKIIRASMAALGKMRGYQSIEQNPEGEIFFEPVLGDLNQQAKHIIHTIVPHILNLRDQPKQIGILYRAARLGDKLAYELESTGRLFERCDRNTLIKRNSRLARFIESCAEWVLYGWRMAMPSYENLLKEAMNLVYAGRASETEQMALSNQLISFLRAGSYDIHSTNAWLKRLYHTLILPWQGSSRNNHKEWVECEEMIIKTDPLQRRDIPLEQFIGPAPGAKRITLSTFHSAKGREFDAVVIYGANNGLLPENRDQNKALHEARRLFYVGVTRSKQKLYIVYEQGNCSPWVNDIMKWL